MSLHVKTIYTDFSVTSSNFTITKPILSFSFSIREQYPTTGWCTPASSNFYLFHLLLTIILFSFHHFPIFNLVIKFSSSLFLPLYLSSSKMESQWHSITHLPLTAFQEGSCFKQIPSNSILWLTLDFFTIHIFLLH